MISKVYNLKQTGRPAYISAAKTGKHSDVVWQVCHPCFELLSTDPIINHFKWLSKMLSGRFVILVLNYYQTDLIINHFKWSSNWPDDALMDHFRWLSKVRWTKDNLDGYLNFYSVSGDGNFYTFTFKLYFHIKNFHLKTRRTRNTCCYIGAFVQDEWPFGPWWRPVCGGMMN